MTIKQKEIAEMATLSSQMLSNILNGRRRPSWITAKRLAIATNTDPILWMEGSMNEIKEAIKSISPAASDRTAGS